MFVVVECNESLPAGHKAMGFGIAYALCESKKEAMEYQLSQGIRRHTMIVEENGYDSEPRENEEIL